jgi:hypothetical protein
MQKRKDSSAASLGIVFNVGLDAYRMDIAVVV